MQGEPIPTTDLSLATIEELVTELMSRHTALLIVREFESKNKSDCRDTLFDYSGSLNSAIGMAHSAITHFARLNLLIDPQDDG